MASLMANGRKISLAPTVLGYIYHGLGQVVSHPCFPINYVVGWLAETFLALYSQRPHSECLANYPALIHYAGILARRFTLAQARSIFINGESISFGASAFLEQSQKGRDLIDIKLLDEDFKFLLFTRSSVLPI